MNVQELSTQELEELKSRYIDQLIDEGEETEETINNITLNDVKTHYEGIDFVEEDFFCNIKD